MATGTCKLEESQRLKVKGVLSTTIRSRQAVLKAKGVLSTTIRSRQAVLKVKGVL